MFDVENKEYNDQYNLENESSDSEVKSIDLKNND